MNIQPASLMTLVTREPFTDFFKIHVPNPKGGWHLLEELDVEDTIEWFRVRGADMILLEKALDHVWNLQKAAFEITNYKEPPIKNPRIRANID